MQRRKQSLCDATLVPSLGSCYSQASPGPVSSGNEPLPALGPSAALINSRMQRNWQEGQSSGLWHPQLLQSPARRGTLRGASQDVTGEAPRLGFKGKGASETQTWEPSSATIELGIPRQVI